ncbi:MAG: P-II family nitrogen regulator [Gemmatimonadota bacterium]
MGKTKRIEESQAMVEIRAIVRTEMLDRVVHCLKESGVPRLSVEWVHAIGSGVDPAYAKISFEEGTEFVDKAMVHFICAGEQCGMYTEIIARAARTGRRGDGIVSVHPVLGVTKIRTGVEGLAALD